MHHRPPHRQLASIAEAILQDVRYSVRTLRKSPGFTAVAVTMLALGIGLNTAIFTVIHAALFTGFPLVERNDRLVQITTTRGYIYYPDFEEWRAQATSFRGMALVRGVFLTLSDGSDSPETYFATQVTANTFQLLGVHPRLGRDFLPSDEQRDAEPVVILRYEMWTRRFGGNPAIIGQTVRIDGVPAKVIGVMPAGFSFPTSQDLWTPLVPSAAALRRDIGYAQHAYARLADGVAIENARAEIDAIGRRLASAYPRTNQAVDPIVRGFDEWFIGANARTLYKSMWGAVGFLLLIVCANVATLLIAHATGRSRDMSIRLALGATRWRIVHQFLVEGLTLSTFGGVAAWWIAKTGVQIYASAQTGNGVLLSLAMGGGVITYLIAISCGTGLLAGLAAAAHLTTQRVSNASGGRRIAGEMHTNRVFDLFVTTEMVLALVLLASAGLIIRSFANVHDADVGVDRASVLTASLYIPPDRYTSTDAQRSFYRDLGTRLRGLPGVTSVGLGSAAPTDYAPRVAYELADAAAVSDQSRPTVAELVISPTYFDTVGARVLSGRGFDDADRASTVPVVIVNQRFVDQNWPGQVAIGRRLRLLVAGREATSWLTVVGVVSNIVQNDRTRQTFEPLAYVPYEQHPQPNMFAFARTRVPPASLARAVRRAISAIDPNLPVPALWPLTERFERAYAFERNATALFSLFAVVALLLASLGLYATVSHTIKKRSQEIGVRIAIGASSRDILALVFKQGFGAVTLGLVLGLGATLALSGVLKSQLVGVAPADPVALFVASAVLVLSAAVGCWIPARLALRVDPIVALRHE